MVAVGKLLPGTASGGCMKMGPRSLDDERPGFPQKGPTTCSGEELWEEISHDLPAYVLSGLLMSSHFDPTAKSSG